MDCGNLDKQTRDWIIQVVAQLIRQKANGEAYNVAHHAVTKHEHLFDVEDAFISAKMTFEFKCSDLLNYAEIMAKRTRTMEPEK